MATVDELCQRSMMIWFGSRFYLGFVDYMWFSKLLFGQRAVISRVSSGRLIGSEVWSALLGFSYLWAWFFWGLCVCFVV